MKEFERLHPMSQSDFYRYEGMGDTIPLTLADTDFETAEEVAKAIRERAAFPLFGYVKEDKGWAEAIVSFYKRRHALSLSPSCLRFSTGVIASLTASIRAFTAPGDKVAVCLPAYNGFLSTIPHNGREVLGIPMKRENGSYSYDFEAMEEAFASCRLFVYCHPYNPLGKENTFEETERILSLAKKHDVIVFSDEIHGEILRPGLTHDPIFAHELAKEVAIMASSPAKAFNLAGIQTSFAYAENPSLLEALGDALYADDCGEASSFAYVAAKACYESGDRYLDALNERIAKNEALFREALSPFPFLHLVSGPATYLLYVEATGMEDVEDYLDYLKNVGGVAFSSGTLYGDKNHFRVNIAVPEATLQEAIRRFVTATKQYCSKR